MAEAKTVIYKKYYNKASDEGGMVYIFGLFGALIYFILAADGFWEVIVGILQSIVWPAIIVYKLLESFYGIA